ncbi:phospholipase D-like domain-containing protein [Clostridium taeniosporum]|uniref:phospholipase D n=1 Tax=Clostridium taeniosporum TaxID=394958 RepID=A0A1D7XJ64_9CLOT|nr:phospholipase D-like domain-containing protein [Clostridium taeniosporum]AOR23387.1 carbohydrate-binding protein [Clostridium taeniosporum]
MSNFKKIKVLALILIFTTVINSNVVYANTTNTTEIKQENIIDKVEVNEKNIEDKAQNNQGEHKNSIALTNNNLNKDKVTVTKKIKINKDSPMVTDKSVKESGENTKEKHDNAEIKKEDFATPIDYGFWFDEDNKNKDIIRAYVDLGVNNYEYHKKITLNMHIERENGAIEHYLYHLKYKGNMEDDREKWGTDTINIDTNTSWNGKIKNVYITYNILKDINNDGKRELCSSKNKYLIATLKDLDKTKLKSNIGIPKVAKDNDYINSNEVVDTSLAETMSQKFKDSIPKTDVYFAPYGNPECRVIKEIEKVIKNKQKDPNGYHYIHASYYDINDYRIVDKLIEAHNKGVEVMILSDSSHMYTSKTWETEYKKMQQAGIKVLGICRKEFLASNHTKIAIYDGNVVSTGSYNWEYTAAEQNCENICFFTSKELASVYEQIFQSVAGLGEITYKNSPSSKINVYYSQYHNIPKAIYDEIENAKDEVVISMFTLRHLNFNDNGVKKDMLDALIRAEKRGVKVRLVLESNIADEGEYYGKTTPNELTDEWLSENGIDVVKVHTNYHGNKYSTMHHKFAVIDRKIVLTGSANWFSATIVSDDDLIVIRDKNIAKQYFGEFVNLRSHYDPKFDAKEFPQTKLSFSVFNNNTKFGEKLYVVGNIPQLGNWDINNALELNGENWPNWKSTNSITLPSGMNFEYKYVIKTSTGLVYESGENRQHIVDPIDSEDNVQESFNKK